MDVLLVLLALGMAVWAWFRLAEKGPGTFFGIVGFAVVVAIAFLPTACADFNQLSTQELLTLADPDSGVTCIVKDQRIGTRALVAAAVILVATWVWTRNVEGRSSIDPDSTFREIG